MLPGVQTGMQHPAGSILSATCFRLPVILLSCRWASLENSCWDVGTGLVRVKLGRGLGGAAGCRVQSGASGYGGD